MGARPVASGLAAQWVREAHRLAVRSSTAQSWAAPPDALWMAMMAGEWRDGGWRLASR